MNGDKSIQDKGKLRWGGAVKRPSPPLFYEIEQFGGGL